MKAKLKNGLIVDVRVYMLNSGLVDSRTLYMDNDRGITYYEDELEFLPDTHEEVTIEGYVARDRNNDLSLYQTYPERQSKLGYWRDGYDEIELPQDSFPEVTWESEPLHVKLTITPMEL